MSNPFKKIKFGAAPSRVGRPMKHTGKFANVNERWWSEYIHF